MTGALCSKNYFRVSYNIMCTGKHISQGKKKLPGNKNNREKIFPVSPIIKSYRGNNYYEKPNNPKTNKKMKKNRKSAYQNAQVVEGLQDQVENVTPNYGDLEYLKTHTPEFTEETSSAKMKAEREPRVQSGLAKIKTICGDTAPELFLLLAAWWENKEARKTIKRAIDAEAAAKGVDANTYMQSNLREFAQTFAGLADATDRMLYAVTYYKPRAGQVKDSFKVYSIGGELYNVNLRVLAELREQYTDKAELLEEIKRVSTKVEMESL